MPAIADLMLEGIKQYAQFLKKTLHISLAHAQEMTAKLHRFSDWHELVETADRNPFDERLRGAAASQRSSPAVRTPASVELAIQAETRFPSLSQLSGTDCTATNLGARGFTDREQLAAAFHIDFRSAHVALNLSPYTVEPRLRLNLFDPRPRFVAVSGVTGWGKSVLALSMAWEHANQGGNVCILDPFTGQLSTQDLAGRMSEGLLRCDGATLPSVDGERSLPPFSRITGLRFKPFGAPLPPLDIVLRNTRERLLPFSVLVIDEAMAFRCSPEQLVRVAKEIDQILASGSAVIWASQDFPTQASLPLDRTSQECSVVLLGKTYPGMPMPNDQAMWKQISSSLARTSALRGWVACVFSPGGKSDLYLIEAQRDAIEARTIGGASHAQ